MSRQAQTAAITGSTKLEEATPIEEIEGKLGSDPEERRLMRSVLESDEEVINDGKLITAAINTGMGAFTPDMLFDRLVTNYRTAKKIYGQSMLRELTGYSESQVERNLHIPEFRQELKQKIAKKTAEMAELGLIDREGSITEKGLKLNTIMLYTEELNRLAAKGLLGEQENRKSQSHGLKEDVKKFRKEDRYRDIAVRKTVKAAVRRGHSEIQKGDLASFERESKGKRIIIYALDASGSMKGSKLGACKKAGIALAYKAIEEKDKVGLIVFGKEVKKKTAPTTNFRQLLKEIATITAKEKTNISETIKEAIGMFPKEEATKHLILITDAMPTHGEKPEHSTIEAAATAAGRKITVSVIGINLKDEGKAMAEKIAEAGKGRIFTARNSEEIDALVLEDYYSS